MQKNVKYFSPDSTRNWSIRDDQGNHFANNDTQRRFFKVRNRADVSDVKNSTQGISDTFGSSFNQQPGGALEKLATRRAPGQVGWNCNTDVIDHKALNNMPSGGTFDEHHFRSDNRKANRRVFKSHLEELDRTETQVFIGKK